MLGKIKGAIYTFKIIKRFGKDKVKIVDGNIYIYTDNADEHMEATHLLFDIAKSSGKGVVDVASDYVALIVE